MFLANEDQEKREFLDGEEKFFCSTLTYSGVYINTWCFVSSGYCSRVVVIQLAQLKRQAHSLKARVPLNVSRVIRSCSSCNCECTFVYCVDLVDVRQQD